MTHITLRPCTTSDEPFLCEMLFHAAMMAQDGAQSPAAALENPYLAKFVQDWGQDGDLGLIAVEAATGRSLGAAWLRHFPLDKRGYPATDERFPELAIAVLPDQTGRGIGAILLQALLEAARPHEPGIVLSVRAENPARRLYERMGFVTTAEIVNRVGKTSYVMELVF